MMPAMKFRCFLFSSALTLAHVQFDHANATTTESPFSVERCNGIDIKDITVAELREVRVSLVFPTDE